jgi:tRNA C32,U32 (ribose-2'-O)-methylase TrmJ
MNTGGVSEEALVKADFAYYIPMKGMIQSLNASVAAAVSVYEALQAETRMQGTMKNQDCRLMSLMKWLYNGSTNDIW